MDLAIHGSPTPRVQQRHILGSARSAAHRLPKRNPITGEEYNLLQTGAESIKETSQSAKPNGVPSLDLKYLRDESSMDHKPLTGAYDYRLNTPDTASTISWGTDTDELRKMAMLTEASRKSKRPGNVPSLNLQEEKTQVVQPPPKAVKEPSVWDKEEVVPENLPAPSARHQQMYQQYAQDMRDSYRAHSSKVGHRVNKEEVDRLVDEMQKTTNPKSEAVDVSKNTEEEMDILQDSWSQQHLSNKQMLKKLDADELRENNMKQKLVETVMIDQLSRAVISDPEQDERQTHRFYDLKQSRGTHRFLHDSKVSTRATATEDLLSQRVRFGARIVTSNGRDAVRELTGFFFSADNTLTIYEFRKFGKSAKALPFIYRGEYKHVNGPKKGQPYSLVDIYVGARLTVSTSGQQTLPDSLSQLPYIRFSVTDVDEEDKAELLLEGVEPSRRQETYNRLLARSQEEQVRLQFLHLIQKEVCEQIQKRAIKTRLGLGRYYRSKDEYQTGLLDIFELERGLATFHIQLSQEKLNVLAEILDLTGEGSLLYQDYLAAVLGEMSEFCRSLVRKAFLKCDPGKRGYVTLADVKKFFNVNASPSGLGGGTNALQAFLDAVKQSPKQEEISYLEFEEYYEGLSIAVLSDEDFRNILRNTWNI